MHHSADVLPHSEKSSVRSALTQRAKQAMDSVCELLTTSQPHFMFCFKPSKVPSTTLECCSHFDLVFFFVYVCVCVEWEKKFQL
jgi:uncharacterized membrane protein YagU involved in acid resistance